MDYCIVEFAKGSGIGVSHANITLSNSIVRWCQGANIWLEGSSTEITRNRIYGAGHGGIEVSNANPMITYNTIYDNGLGIVPINTSNPVIRYNSIHDNRFIGILIMGLSSPLVEYNNIVRNADEGIKISTANPTIGYNNIYSNGRAQLLLEQGDVVATDNWWGSADKEEVEPSIQVRGGTISYQPYLTSLVDIPELSYNYENDEVYAHPPATERDIFPYFWPSDETRSIVSSWTTVNNPSGIAWDGEYLWVVNLDKKLLKYDLAGKLIDSLAAPGTLPIALAYDGRYLWSLDLSERKAHQFDFSGKVIKSVPAPVGNYGEGGLAYDGQYLWAVDKDINDKIFKIDPSNGSILGWINPPGDETWGMTMVDSHLWACEWTNDFDNYIVVEMELSALTE